MKSHSSVFRLSLAALPLGVAVSANAGLIDSFTTAQVVTDESLGNPPTSSQFDTVGIDILGGERDMQVGSGTGLLGTTGNASGGELLFANSPTSQGFLSVVYDGNDNSALKSLAGLGGVDLTDGGSSDAFTFVVDFADFLVAYSITASDMTGKQVSFNGLLPTGISGGGDEVLVVTEFSDFTGDAGFSFANIGSVELFLNAEELAADVKLSDFRTQQVPEPASLTLLAFGGALLARRRRRA